MSLSTELKDDELSIGKLIKKQRKEKGLTQQALAEKLNVSPQAVSKWEREICDYLKEVMETLPWIRVSKILSESLDELVDELTVFIFELVSANGNDIGETVKYIIRELDTMNYNLFRGSCLNMLDTGLIRNNYLNRRDIAIDVGIVTLIKLLLLE